MTESTFSNPTQYETTEVMIDDQDVRGLFLSISIYENIYSPLVTGEIVINDTDGAGFIEENNLEFIEPISLKFKNANGDTLEFKGVLNKLKNEVVMGSRKTYCLEFSSETMRKNEATFVTNAYKETNPEEIVEEMVEKLGGTLNTKVRAKKMNYVASRKRPRDIIEYVCTHALTQETEATLNDDSTREEAKGTTGFLCWQTLDEFKFASVKDILDGKVGTEHKDFKTQLANRNLSMDDSMKSIIQYEFKQIGDFQTKLRSGAFRSKNVSMDLDTGIYKEYEYDNITNMTDKQKEAMNEITKGSAELYTRVYFKPISNQKFTNDCPIALPLTGDQSRGYLQQNSGGQNTFNDQVGMFTFYPHFEFHAGDILDCKISQVKDEENAQGGYDKKHSGKYVMKSVAHTFMGDGRAYTRVATIRSTTQQNEESAAKS